MKNSTWLRLLTLSLSLMLGACAPHRVPIGSPADTSEENADSAPASISTVPQQDLVLVKLVLANALKGDVSQASLEPALSNGQLRALQRVGWLSELGVEFQFRRENPKLEPGQQQVITQLKFKPTELNLEASTIDASPTLELTTPTATSELSPGVETSIHQPKFSRTPRDGLSGATARTSRVWRPRLV